MHVVLSITEIYLRSKRLVLGCDLVSCLIR